MFSTTKKLEYFRVVDDHSGDQRSQLIFLLDLNSQHTSYDLSVTIWFIYNTILDIYMSPYQHYTDECRTNVNVCVMVLFNYYNRYLSLYNARWVSEKTIWWKSIKSIILNIYHGICNVKKSILQSLSTFLNFLPLVIVV